jgi:lambda family phage portal protein
LLKIHPGDVLNPQFSTERVRVPAKYVIHAYKPIRLGQLRGQPWMAQILIKLYELDQYDDAELVRKKVGAMFAGFIEKAAPEDEIMPNQTPDGDQAMRAGLEPGTLQELLPGEKMSFSTPPDVGTQYETFMRQQLRNVARGMKCTYEQLTGDLTGVNYSSIRAGLLEFRRGLEQFQHQVMVFQVCRPIHRAWVDAVILSGLVTGAKAGDPELYHVRWMPQGFPWVDPFKDAKASIMEVRAGYSSRSDQVAELGYDSEEIDAQVAADNARADALKLHYDSDGRVPALPGEGDPVAAGSSSGGGSN